MISFENVFTARQALMVEDGALNHKIDYITFFRRFLILKAIQITLLVQELRQLC